MGQTRCRYHLGGTWSMLYYLWQDEALKAHHSAICNQVTDRECRADTYTQPTWSQCILLPARLGHSVSYSQLEEIDTALCLQKLSLSLSFPTNIHPGVFTTWDNIDRREETVSGEGTSYRVELPSKPSWSTHSHLKPFLQL